MAGPASTQAEELNERAALLAARDGDETAFSCLVERYRPLVLKSCSVTLGEQNRGELEDCVQAVFVLFHRRLPKLNEQVVISGWLYRTARYVSLDVCKKQRRRSRREMEASEMMKLESVTEEVLEQHRVLHDALAELPVGDQDLIHEKYIQGSSSEEMASQRGVNAAALRKRLQRSMDRLRKKLEIQGFACSTVMVTEMLREAFPVMFLPEKAVPFMVTASGVSMAGKAAASKWITTMVWATIGFSSLSFTLGASVSAVWSHITGEGSEGEGQVVQPGYPGNSTEWFDPSILEPGMMLADSSSSESLRLQQIHQLRTIIQMLQQESAYLSYQVERSGSLRLTWYEKEALLKDVDGRPPSEEVIRDRVRQQATYTAVARMEALGVEKYMRYLQLQEDIQVLTARLLYLEETEWSVDPN